MEAGVYTSTREWSCGQRFITCPMRIENQCKFFHWIDGPTCSGCTSTIPWLNHKIQEQEDIIDDLEVSIVELVHSEKNLRRTINDQLIKELIDSVECYKSFVTQLQKSNHTLHKRERKLYTMLAFCILIIIVLLFPKRSSSSFKLMQLRP